MNPNEKLSNEEVREFLTKLVEKKKDLILIEEMESTGDTYSVYFHTERYEYLLKASQVGEHGLLRCQYRDKENKNRLEHKILNEGPLNFWTWLSILHDLVGNELIEIPVKEPKSDNQTEDKENIPNVEAGEVNPPLEDIIDKEEKIDEKQLKQDIINDFSKQVDSSFENISSNPSPSLINPNVKKTQQRAINPDDYKESEKKEIPVAQKQTPIESKNIQPRNEEKVIDKNDEQLEQQLPPIEESLDLMYPPTSPWSTGKKAWGK
jgi:hypothetical protein